MANRDEQKKPLSLSAKKRQQFRRMGDGEKYADGSKAIIKSPNIINTSTSKEQIVPGSTERSYIENVNGCISRRNTIPSMVPQSSKLVRFYLSK